MRRIASIIVLSSVAALLSLAAPPLFGGGNVYAQPSDADEELGRALATEAMAAYKDKNFSGALEKFTEAAEVYPTGQVLRMRGYSLMALERWVEAKKVIEKALEAEFKPLVPRDAEHAEDQLAELKKHISEIEIVSSVTGAAVVIDGGQPRALPVTVRLGEGKHQFLVSAEGFEDVQREIDIKGGQKETIALDPTSSEPEDPQPKPEPRSSGGQQAEKPEKDDEPSSLFSGWFPHQRAVGLAVAGAGVAVAGVAIGTGVYGATLRSAVSDNVDAHNLAYGLNCSQGNAQLCRYDIELINRDGARANDYQTAALATGIAAAGLVAVGATFYFFAPDASLAPGQGGPDAVGIQCAPQLGAAIGLGCLGSF